MQSAHVGIPIFLALAGFASYFGANCYHGLQRLIDDVLNGGVDFKAVIVFDVSRWGRFQDSDEVACYEFLRKRAGIAVHYCAEQFSNDGTPFSTFLRTIKRTMAAEYVRELSAKVLAGQRRLAANGYKFGGRAGFGLRRLLLDSQRRPKMILQEGEEKHLATDRVTYTLGPPEEVAIVREIFSMFLDQDRQIIKIARVLNERRVTHRLWEFRWIVNARRPSPRKALIVVRLQPDNKTIRDFVVFSEEPKTMKRLWLSDDWAYRSGTVYPTANAVADAIVAASNHGNQSRARRG